MVALLARLVPPADKPVAGWHVSAAVDLVAYHFSWLWILVPLALCGDKHPTDYLGLFALGMTLSLVHRYYTLPYVYLDKQVFAQHITRFTLFFFLLNLGSVASAFFFKWKAPKHFFHPVDVAVVLAGVAVVTQCIVADKRGHTFTTRALLVAAAPFTLAVLLGIAGLWTSEHAAVAVLVAFAFAAAAVFVARETRAWVFAVAALVAALCGGLATVVDGVASISLNNDAVKGSAIVGVVGVVAALWNIWHTMMQKFGIMRVYAAKSSVPLEKRTPPWVDRFLIFGSFPLLAVVVGPAQRDVIAHQSKSVTQYLLPVIDGIAAVAPYVLPVAAVVAAASIGLFVWHERKLTSWPRLSMGIALTLLNASFLVVSPLKVYIAYGFSHAVEYMVFVWAFLRRRYAQPLAHRPVLQRALAHPFVAYAAYTLVIGVVYFVIDYGKDYGLHQGGIEIFGVKIGTWLFSFAIWQSIAHFYFDGFLWKMRAPAVRASL